MDTDEHLRNEYMDEVKSIEQTYRASKQYKLPQDIKPCISALIDERHNSNIKNISFMIAVELKRLGRETFEAIHQLNKWNSKNLKQLAPRTIEATVNSAYKKDYQHGCNGPLAQEYCLFTEKSLCPFYKELIKKYPKRSIQKEFLKLGWPKHLNNVPVILYVLAIPELEHRRGFKPGSKIYANYNEIRNIAGISQASIKPGLQELEKVKLIKLKIGLRHAHYNIATEIQRIIPLPKPPPKK